MRKGDDAIRMRRLLNMPAMQDYINDLNAYGSATVEIRNVEAQPPGKPLSHRITDEIMNTIEREGRINRDDLILAVERTMQSTAKAAGWYDYEGLAREIVKQETMDKVVNPPAIGVKDEKHHGLAHTHYGFDEAGNLPAGGTTGWWISGNTFNASSAGHLNNGIKPGDGLKGDGVLLGSVAGVSQADEATLAVQRAMDVEAWRKKANEASCTYATAKAEFWRQIRMGGRRDDREQRVIQVDNECYTAMNEVDHLACTDEVAYYRGLTEAIQKGIAGLVELGVIAPDKQKA